MAKEIKEEVTTEETNVLPNGTPTHVIYSIEELNAKFKEIDANVAQSIQNLNAAVQAVVEFSKFAKTGIGYVPTPEDLKTMEDAQAKTQETKAEVVETKEQSSEEK